MHPKVREIVESPGIHRWIASRPPMIQEMIAKWPTCSVWRRPGFGPQSYHAILSWCEDGTVTAMYFMADDNGRILLPTVDRVFGIDPNELQSIEVTDAVQQVAIDLVYTACPDTE